MNRLLGADAQDTVLAHERFHAWVVFWGVPATIRESVNVSSITKDATGKFTVTWQQAFASTAYAMVMGCGRIDTLTTGIKADITATSTPTTTSVQIEIINAVGDALIDPDVQGFAAVGRV